MLGHLNLHVILAMADARQTCACFYVYLRLREQLTWRYICISKSEDRFAAVPMPFALDHSTFGTAAVVQYNAEHAV
ncbi:hypothetical protein BD309DRAFT_969708 [Dichomitus squalens]|nr:hypothetical protein BD309DRAFT_969708 [Dichomitus squalens]